MIEKGSDVVYEERVKHLRNLFLVGKIQCTLKRNPNARLATMIACPLKRLLTRRL